MKNFKTILSEVKKSVASWQAGVRSAQLAGSPDPHLFKDPNFSAGFNAGMNKGPEAAHPSHRAIKVKRLINRRKAMGY